MLNGIKDFVEIQKEIPESTGSISEFLEDVALATDLDKDDQDTNKVALMTIHLAKGLEFPIVYIVGLEENLFPSAMNLNSRNDLEEERRLFYVALTRAEKEAYLSFAMKRAYHGDWMDALPSRFINEIPEDSVERNEFDSGKIVDDFEFNQDNSIEFDEGYRSPGWERYKKNKILKWKK